MQKRDLYFYLPNSKINLIGYTSTSKKFNCALNFAFKNLAKDQVPVVFEIHFHGQTGLFELTRGYSAFPDEGEVLVQDGLQYQVKSNTELFQSFTNKKYHLVQLQYPARP